MRKAIQNGARGIVKNRALWVIWSFMIVLVTTMPWSDFQDHSHWSLVRWIPFQDALLTRRSVFDIISNLLLYVPFGYLYLRFKSPAGWPVLLQAAILATVLSASTELFQVFSHNRIPSATDIFINILGAHLGAVGALVQGGKGH